MRCLHEEWHLSVQTASLTREITFLHEYSDRFMQKRKFPTKKVLFSIGKNFFRQKRDPFLMKPGFSKKTVMFQ